MQRKSRPLLPSHTPRDTQSLTVDPRKTPTNARRQPQYESAGSHAPYAGVACGDYTIGSTWSGQFGPGEGFTTLSVVRGGEIVYPAYKDSQLVDWVVVKPDQSYTPVKLP